MGLNRQRGRSSEKVELKKVHLYLLLPGLLRKKWDSETWGSYLGEMYTNTLNLQIPVDPLGWEKCPHLLAGIQSSPGYLEITKKLQISQTPSVNSCFLS